MIREFNMMRLLASASWLALWMAGCGSESDFSPCDIRHKSCQDAIFLEVQRLRGTEWDPWIDRPPMRVISAAEYRKELLASQKQAEQSAMNDTSNAVDHYTVALELLGLLDPQRTKTSSVDTQVSNVAAFYSPSSKSVTIIDPGQAGDIEYGTSVLAHELVHAAQDREFNLSTFALATTVDGDYARSTIIEGEARLYENLLMIGAAGMTIDEVNWDRYHGALLDGARQRVFDADSPQFQLYGLMYPVGSRYLTDRYLAGGNVSVRKVWQHMPTQMHFLVDRDDTSEADPQPRLTEGDPGYTFVAQPHLPCAVPKAPDGYEYYGDTTVGALYMYGVATRFASSPEGAWTIARGLLADRLSIFRSDAEETLLVWQLRLTKTQAKAFSTAALVYYGADAVSVSGNEVSLMLYSADAAPSWDTWKTCTTLK